MRGGIIRQRGMMGCLWMFIRRWWGRIVGEFVVVVDGGVCWKGGGGRGSGIVRGRGQRFGGVRYLI